MRRWMVTVAAVALGGCGGPSWPDERFPAGMEVERTLFAGESGGFREACIAMVAELTEESATRFRGSFRRVNGASVPVPPTGWRTSPMTLGDGEKLYAMGALGGCNNEGQPLGDLEGALKRPGAYYKLVNGGEGLAVIVPRSKLAGWFYAG